MTKKTAAAPGRPRSPDIQGYVDRFARMRIGDSFFVAGATREQLEFLRAPFKDAGMGVSIWHTDRDEIYHTAGVRIKRMEGSFDEL